MIDTGTKEGRQKRINEIIREHISKSKHPSDYHGQEAMWWGAEADWRPEDDEFMPEYQ